MIIILLLFIGFCSVQGGDPTKRLTLMKTLARLESLRIEPEEEDWKVFRDFCHSRERQRECTSIFEYFKNVLIPKEIIGRKGRRRIAGWRSWHISGMPKKVERHMHSGQLYKTLQIGDDSSVIGVNYAIVSDGITKDPDSDYFSWTVVEFIQAGLQHIDPYGRKVEKDLMALSTLLELLIGIVELPGAATLLFVYRVGGTAFIGTLGDSEAKVIRMGTVHYRSPFYRDGGRHDQLSYKRPESVKRMTLDKVAVARGDMLVLGSDGVWDNVREDDVTGMLSKRKEAKGAAMVMLERTVEGKESQRKECYRVAGNKERCVGSRKDDITIVILQV